MSNYKNAEHFGYKVGDKFKYLPKVKSVNGKFDRNDVLTLQYDDGTHCPRFENQYNIKAYEYLHLLEKLEETDNPQKGQQEVTETVTICPSATIQEMLDASSCDNVSVQITVDSVIVYWNGMVLLVDNEVSIEQILKAITLLKKQRINV